MRISRHQMFMDIAHVVAKRSTCFRESVGAIIVYDNNIISMGYNGAPAGEEHCTHHPEGKCSLSIHAEANAINRVDWEDPWKSNGSDLYVTHLPCLECIKLIIKHRQWINRIFFSITYGDARIAQLMLAQNHLKLLRVLPSGVITTPDRSEIVNVET